MVVRVHVEVVHKSYGLVPSVVSNDTPNTSLDRVSKVGSIGIEFVPTFGRGFAFEAEVDGVI